MSEHLFLLLLSYVALTALLGTMLLATRLPVWAKVLLVAGVTALYFASYQGWRETQGWPAAVPIPDRFLLHAAVIEEPDKESGGTGAIRVWVTDLTSGRPATEPRAYLLPYDKPFHSDLVDALRGMRNGIVQLGRVTSSNDPQRPTDSTRFGDRRQRIELYPLPDPALPEK